MAKVAVYNMEGKEVDSLELNDAHGSPSAACKQPPGNTEG